MHIKSGEISGFSSENGHSERNQWRFWRYKTKWKLFELRFPTPKMPVPRKNIERVRISIVQACELIRFISVVSNCSRNTFKERYIFLMYASDKRKKSENIWIRRRKNTNKKWTFSVLAREMCDANSNIDIECQCRPSFKIWIFFSIHCYC